MIQRSERQRKIVIVNLIDIRFLLSRSNAAGWARLDGPPQRRSPGPHRAGPFETSDGLVIKAFETLRRRPQIQTLEGT